MSLKVLDADLLLLNCRIIGGNQTHGSRGAVAVKYGRIAAVGNTRELSRMRAKRKIDLEGKSISPGFIDAHCHFILYCIALRMVDCRIPLDGDMNDVLGRISSLVSSIERGEWVKGWGFADYKAKQRRMPTRQELDLIAPDNPVVVIHTSWHTCVVNSRALALMGIDSSTPDPEGGCIERDVPTGEPNGILHETAMQSVSFDSLISKFVQLDSKEKMKSLRRGALEFSSYGITSICDAQVYPEFLTLFQEADACGVLKFRVQTMPFYNASSSLLESGLRGGFGSDRLSIGPIKILGDGSLSGRTAAVREPFNNGSVGILLQDQEKLNEIVACLYHQGQRISVHAIGDRAVEQALNAYESVGSASDLKDKRFRIEHAGILRPDLVKRMNENSIMVATQPRMLFEQGDSFLASCGEKRMSWVYPYRTLIDAGLHVAGSSDCPVVSANPLLGMRAAVTRKTEAGQTLAPNQILEPKKALKMFTEEAAYVLGMEDSIGTIAEGKLADLVVLSDDISNTSPDSWGEQVRVKMTIRGGEIVYQEEKM